MLTNTRNRQIVNGHFTVAVTSIRPYCFHWWQKWGIVQEHGLIKNGHYRVGVTNTIRVFTDGRSDVYQRTYKRIGT